MNRKPKPNMTESILARAELFRRGLMFDGVPQMASTELELPPPDAGSISPAPSQEGVVPASGAAVPAGDAGTTDEIVAGAIKHDSPLETIVAGA